MNVVLVESITDKDTTFNAWSKARADAFQIALDRGYEHINFYTIGCSKPKRAFQMAAGVLNASRLVGAGETVFIQFPYYSDVIQTLLLGTLSALIRHKGARLVVLVHDLLGLRKKDGTGDKTLAAEVVQLSHADVVICHSEAMQDLLVSHGLDAETVILGPFDYLTDEPVPVRKWSADPVVDVAGHLSYEKVGCLYKLPEVTAVTLELFGAAYEPERMTEGPGKVHYMGKCQPDELIDLMTGQYGLVWDGPDLTTCSSLLGDYLRYNSPHKLSLFIAAGMPVIIWSGAAQAAFVREHGIGIAVDTLEDLGERLRAIGKDEYDAMTARVREVATDIVAGNRLARFL